MKISKDIRMYRFSDHSENYSVIRLTCEDGFLLSLCSLGASIRQIKYPCPDGSLKNIALSFAEDAAYAGNPLYAGATLAPCAGRISSGQLPLRDRVCQLTRNENGRHTLHGGSHNASFQNWELLSVSQTDGCAQVTFGCMLPDGLDGFPGSRHLKAMYTLDEQHQLTLDYEAVSDRDTYFNLSNHSYFNLSGDFSQPALNHLLQINADQCICNAPDFIPEGVLAVDGTPFDFREIRSPESQIQMYPKDIQLARNRGYNHGFILNRAKNQDSSKKPDLVCSLPGSPVRLSVFSDAPCMVLYSGGYVEEGLKLSDGQSSCPGCALAFEFQDYPDAPGGHGFPYEITPAGTVWKRAIQYRFTSSRS